MSTCSDVETVIDQQTRDELRPPCECRKPAPGGGHVPCEHAAEWIVRYSCESCGTRHGLDCDLHKEMLAAGSVQCARCHDMLRMVAAPERL